MEKLLPVRVFLKKAMLNGERAIRLRPRQEHPHNAFAKKALSGFGLKINCILY